MKQLLTIVGMILLLPVWSAADEWTSWIQLNDGALNGIQFSHRSDCTGSTTDCILRWRFLSNYEDPLEVEYTLTWDSGRDLKHVTQRTRLQPGENGSAAFSVAGTALEEVSLQVITDAQKISADKERADAQLLEQLKQEERRRDELAKEQERLRQAEQAAVKKQQEVEKQEDERKQEELRLAEQSRKAVQVVVPEAKPQQEVLVDLTQQATRQITASAPLGERVENNERNKYTFAKPATDCITTFINTNLHNWLAYRNNCSTTLHVFYSNPGFGALDLGPGQVETSGWECGNGCTPSFGACPEGYTVLNTDMEIYTPPMQRDRQPFMCGKLK
jgi:hypothetical protein